MSDLNKNKSNCINNFLIQYDIKKITYCLNHILIINNIVYLQTFIVNF